MRVAVIAPHMDDEVLGVGGTITKHVRNGDDVAVCIVANRAYGNEYLPDRIERQKNAALRAKDILGYQEITFLGLNDEQLDNKIIDVVVPLEGFISKYRPEIVYLNHRGDSNQDHRAVFQAGIIACRTFSVEYVKRVMCYEVLSSTEQAPPFSEFAFLPNVYVDIQGFLEAKVEALACYEDELRAFPHPRSAEGIRVLAKKRGMEIGYSAAEAFSLIREKWSW